VLSFGALVVVIAVMVHLFCGGRKEESNNCRIFLPTNILRRRTTRQYSSMEIRCMDLYPSWRRQERQHATSLNCRLNTC
jgi:hypothetical protein